MKMRNRFKILAAAFISLAVATALNAEVFESTYTTAVCEDYELITKMLVGPGVARHPTGALIPQTKSYQVGVFSNLVAKIIPSFTNGVILSTGKIDQGASLSNECSDAYWEGEAVWPQKFPPEYGSDKDLHDYFGYDLWDQAGIVLYIQPRNKTINIPFVMASEEFYYDSSYPEYPDQEEYEEYSDKFAFFLKEIADASDPSAFDAHGNVIDDGSPMTPYQNIAQLPGGGDVEISSVNQHTNSQYFVSNVVSNEEGELVFEAGDINFPMEFNGAIVGPVAVAEGLDTNKIYKLKIIIADEYNNIVNSAVFLRERGITSGADLKIDVTGPAFIAEPGSVVFTNAVSNIGPATADGVVVTNYLPVGAVVRSKTLSSGLVVPITVEGTGCLITNGLIWTIGDRFAPGSNAVMTVTCELPETGSYRDRAVVVTSTGDYDESNNGDECVTQVGVPPETPITVRAISTNMVYGSTLGLSDLQFISSIEGTNGTETVSGISVKFLDGAGDVVSPSVATVGTYRIVLSNIGGAGLPSPAMTTYVEGELTIGKRELEITPKNRTKEYGQSFVLFGMPNEVWITKGSLVNGDSITSVDLASEGTAPTKPWKEWYDLTATNAQGPGLSNYEITYGTGKLGVLKFKLTITANDTNKVYGTTVEFAGTEFTTTPEKLPNGEKVATVSMTCPAAESELTAAGTYVTNIIPSHVITGINTNNYDITFSNGTLRVDKATVMIIADDTNRVYGTTVAFAGTEFTTLPETLPNGEKIETVAIRSVDGRAGDATSAAGVYQENIVPFHEVTGINTNNYDITFSNGTLRVTKAALTIIADDTNRVYGTTVAFAGTEFTTLPETLPNSEKIETVAIRSVDGRAGDATSAAGVYQENIVPFHEVTGINTNNYDIAFSNGTLRVTKAALTITANDATNCYGSALAFTGKEFTISQTELPNDETVETVTLTNLKPIDMGVGTYAEAIVPSHALTGTIKTNNYNITFVDGTLTITQAVLTITANSTNRPYGTTIDIPVTAFTTVPETLPNDETVDAVTITCPEANQWDALLGTYPIVPSHEVTGSLDTNNYNIAFVNGTLKVTPTEFTATAEPVAKYYDGLPTNIVVKLQGLPAVVTPTIEYSYAESDGYVTASAFTGPTNVAESAEVWCRASAPGTTNTVHAKVTILPRVVVEQAESATRAYNGEPLTNAVHFFEGAAASNLAKAVFFDLARPGVYNGPARSDWPDAVGFADTDGIVRAPMTAESTITDPGTQPNVIDQDAVTFTASTKTNNYVISYLDGQLTVTLSTALTLEASDVEKFYDAKPTNVAYVVKVDGTPISDATVRLHEQGSANWILAADFVPYLDTTNVIVDVAVAKHGYVAVTNSATLVIKPRPVTLVAATDSKTYDGTPLTNWTFEVKADATTPGYGFVTEAGEGIECVEMAATSTITEPGTVDNVIATKVAKPGTKLDRNYVVTTENGTLTVDPLGVLTVEASAAEKFYDAVPTNIAYVVKIDGEPTDDAAVSLREKGAEAWIAADDFPAYLDATNVTVQVMATKPGYFAATDEATVWVKPRIVVHHAESGKWEYDGTVHTQGEYFEDADEEAKLSKAKWGTDEVLPNSTGFVAGEGYAARLVMTADSAIKDPGKKPNVIDQSAEKAALKAGTNPVNYELHYLDGELEVMSTAVLKTAVSANLNWNTGLLDLTLTIKNVGEGSVYPASDYWVELTPGPAETGSVASVARTYYLNAPTGTLPNGADYVDLTAAVRAALRSAGGDEVFGPGEEIMVKGVSVYHWKRWSPDKFIDADAFFFAGPLAERVAEMPQQTTSAKDQQIAVATSVDEGIRSSLVSDEAGLADMSLARVYDGVLYAADALAGTIRVQLAKANKKTGLSKLKVTLAPAGEKKVTVSGNFDPNAASFAATAEDGRTLKLFIGKDGLGGSFGDFEIDGARNRYSSKDAEDKAVVAAADGWAGAYSIASPCENGWDTYSVKIAKKGKVTIAGTIADGSTVSASAQMIIGAMGCCVPVVIAKKSVLRTFCIWFGEDGIGIDGLDDAVIGQSKNLSGVAMFGFDVDGLVALLESDAVKVLTEYLPMGAEVLPSGSKWIVIPDENGKAMKSGKLTWDRKSGEINEEKSKIDGYNVSGLKLSYVANKGTFKGSFKVYTIVDGALKSTSVTVAGVMVDGIGYGTAKVGKIGTVAVVVE